MGNIKLKTPNQHSRAKRAQQAKSFLNVSLPAILKSNKRAKAGVGSAELFLKLPPVSQDDLVPPSHQQAREPASVTLRVVDTLHAAHALAKGGDRVAILNMASPLRPGGGVLSGATSQEEHLCSCTTLYPSLQEQFYRLPEVGGIYTPDVLVCRSWDSKYCDLSRKDQFYVDVVTAAMLRLPDLEGSGDSATYANGQDREIIVYKIRNVMRMLRRKGINTVVFGAWGCGAYGNPIGEVAKAWQRVLFGSQTGKNSVKEGWEGLHVVFAIKDRKIAHKFAKSFGNDMVVEDGEEEEDESYEEEQEEEAGEEDGND